MSINNREQVIQLPVLPQSFEVSSPHNHETFETINQGQLKLIGLEGLKSLRLQSFFPVNEYPFNRDNTYKGYEYVNLIEEWRKRRIPIRLIITDTPINLPVVIDDFSYSERDGSGDVYYTLDLSEFKFVQVKRV